MKRRRSRRLVFVYAAQHALLGSTVMRGRQLSEVAQQHGLRDRVDLVALGTPLRNADVFMTKAAAITATESDFHALKAGRNRIFVDPLDEALTPLALEFADVIIAASRQAEIAYRTHYPHRPVFRVDHHVDPRVRAAGPPDRPSAFRTGYFGSLENAVRSTEIERLVDFYSVTGAPGELADWYLRPREYPLHYGVRAWLARDTFKPFVKGFTAAAVGAPILVSGSDAEAMYWLGDHYPFVVRGASTERDIVDALHATGAVFGGPEWREAQATMAEVTQRVTDHAIVESLRRALDEG